MTDGLLWLIIAVMFGGALIWLAWMWDITGEDNDDGESE